MTDVETELTFVDPSVVETTYRICIYAEAGEGKTLAAATAPGPLLVLNADRPSSWQVARRRHPEKDIWETRYFDHTSLDATYRYVQAHPEVQTVVVDPWNAVYDDLVARAPKVKDSRSGDMKPDYEMVNAKLVQFVTRLRPLDVHLVLIAHEKENEGARGDGKTYPRLGGMSLIRKLLGEMDIVAHIERTVPTEEDAEPVWYGRIQPTNVLIGKDGTDSLGERRIADLSRWVELARAANVVAQPDTSDVFDEPSAGSGDGRDAAPRELPTEAEVDAEAAKIAGELSEDEAAALLTNGETPEPTPSPELSSEQWLLTAALIEHDGKSSLVASALGQSVAALRPQVEALKGLFGVRTITALVEKLEALPELA